MLLFFLPEFDSRVGLFRREQGLLTLPCIIGQPFQVFFDALVVVPCLRSYADRREQQQDVDSKNAVSSLKYQLIDATDNTDTAADGGK